MSHDPKSGEKAGTQAGVLPWDEEVLKPLVDLLGRRWVLGVLSGLWHGPLRRVQLRARVGPVSDKSLTATLRVLESAGLVARRSYQEIPPRVDYMLTDVGRSLESLLVTMTEWARATASSSANGATDVQPDAKH